MKNLRVNSSLVLEAVMDGTTIISRLIAGGDYPLLQRYNSATGAITPDFSQTLEGEKPYVYPLVMHSDGSGVCEIKSCTFTYLGTVVATYDKETGEFNINDAWDDVFEGAEKTINIQGIEGAGSTTITVPALCIKGNLYNESNKDTDLIGCYGTVSLSGYDVQFTGLRQEFVIEEETSSMYALWLTVSNGGVIANSIGSVVITPHMDVTGDLKDDAFSTNTRYQIRYYKATANGKVQITSGVNGFVIAEAAQNYALTVPASQVDSNLTVFVELIDTQKSNSRLASASTVVQDLSDPYDIQWQVVDSGNSGYQANSVSGNTIKKGGQASVTANVVNRSTGATDSSNSWNFCLVGYKNDGTILEDATTNTKGFIVKAKSVDVSYNDLLRAGRKLTMHCFASVDTTTYSDVVAGLEQQYAQEYQGGLHQSAR